MKSSGKGKFWERKQKQLIPSRVARRVLNHNLYTPLGVFSHLKKGPLGVAEQRSICQFGQVWYVKNIIKLIIFNFDLNFI